MNTRFAFFNALFDRRRLIASPFSYPWIIHGHIIMEFPNGVKGRGTGFLIGDCYFATAGHCLYDDEEGGLAIKATIYFGRNGNRFLHQVNVDRFIVHPAYLQNDENYDFAVAKISQNLGQQLGWARLIALTDEELKQQDVTVTGYPGIQDVVGTVLNRPSYHMYTMKGPIVFVRKHKIYYHIDTSGGQSGAGVCRDNTRDSIVECIGIHTTGRGPKEEGNGGVRITQENLEIIKDWLRTL